ncbi:Ecto-NOX disulfide-thiol exchanger 1 [Operophtera brumata]|uniref:Ecto-NOX disulfide-thiol exchanger 1 n=1 Tax=Operophtera brumata TaxID=104452 RepID=A0A0L7LRL1_OPEBR|nr:Ecto-NOX disulfide-thiol exchanger 1 [Operophtera brumata]
MIQGNRRDRSRSPVRVDNVGRRRDGKSQDLNKGGSGDMNMMNQMMMSNMYGQGNMMMGGMYPNMMMQTSMMPGSMMPSTGMEMMPSGTGMDLMTQPSMDISSMGGQSSTGTSLDLNMMGGMMMDPSMMGMYSGGMTAGDMSMQEKKEIVLKHCKLSPPEPGTPHPPRRTRPPGCRTIFVGGLPDKIRESVVRDIFENYGRIHTLRLSRKSFCHIRFDRENCVDAAMAISGYRITLTDSRDDQNEFERHQRQVIRAQQQQMQQLSAQEMASRSMSASYRRSPSPVRVQPFSTTAIVQLSEKIKSEELFANSIPTLLAWLERGECSKRNANQFYSMIQATNSHIRRLFNEKMQAEEELQECKERVKNNIQSVINQLEQVAKVLTAAGHQRAWDHFTKPQRKNIETWQKMTQEEFNEKFYSEEIDNANAYNNGYNNKTLDMGLNNKTVDAGCGEAKLIGVMSAFLQVHPHGASLDYVLSYVRALFPSVSQASVHQVLQKHTDVFERTTSGVGACIEHRWSFAAFKAPAPEDASAA